VIDAKFNKEHADLQARIISWPELLKDTADKAPFFQERFQEFIELRDYVANVSYAIPVKLQGNFGRQLQELQQLHEQEKEKAIPKKKFSFARKKPAPK